MSLVVVTGATGIQGGSVARRLAKNPAYKVRGLTRNPNSDKAKALQDLGIELIAADLNDPSTLPQAFKGANAAFVVTDFWAIAPTEGINSAEKKEEQQFKNVVDTVVNLPTLKHLVLSTMPNCRTISGGKLPCPHWDAKARGGEYVQKNFPELHQKTTYVWHGWYQDNLSNQPLMRPQPYLGKHLIAQPAKADSIIPVAGVVIENTGITVEAILASPQKVGGKFVPIHTDAISWLDMTEKYSAAVGKTITYAEFSDSEFAKLIGPVFGFEIARQFRFSEAYPDWYSYHPQDTVSLGELGIAGKVYNWDRGLQYLGDSIRPSA